jgi:hypothetical protein
LSFLAKGFMPRGWKSGYLADYLYRPPAEDLSPPPEMTNLSELP